MFGGNLVAWYDLTISAENDIIVSLILKRERIAEKIYMSFKIIVDSSSDLISLEGVEFASVPLKIMTDEREFCDNAELDIKEMTEYLKKYKGRSRSSCPNSAEWYLQFGEAEQIFCVALTSGLSGSYNSACAAAREYTDEHPDRRVCVIDTLSAGPEVAMVAEKLAEFSVHGYSFDEAEHHIKEYCRHTHLAFSLESLRNFANNGRVHPAVAKLAGLLGIRVIGHASLKGELEVTGKVRGPEKALSDIIANMKQSGYIGGKVRIHHCDNADSAYKLEKRIKNEFSGANVIIDNTRGLCSFYAEIGGLLVGYEGEPV